MAKPVFVYVESGFSLGNVTTKLYRLALCVSDSVRVMWQLVAFPSNVAELRAKAPCLAEGKSEKGWEG